MTSPAFVVTELTKYYECTSLNELTRIHLYRISENCYNNMPTLDTLRYQLYRKQYTMSNIIMVQSKIITDTL